jgi:hypothetical protein
MYSPDVALVTMKESLLWKQFCHREDIWQAVSSLLMASFIFQECGKMLNA